MLRPRAKIRSIDMAVALIKLSVLIASCPLAGGTTDPPSMRCSFQTPPPCNIAHRKFGNECNFYVFSCKQQKSPFRHSTRPFIHTQEKELIDFEVKRWHLPLFKTRTLAMAAHRAFSAATSVRQMKTSCCQMRNAKQSICLSV